MIIYNAGGGDFVSLGLSRPKVDVVKKFSGRASE